MHDWDKINKKTHSKRKKFYWSIKLNSSSKISLHALSHYSKNLFNITCYICNQKSHYFTNYKDEKIKNRLKESDVNWVFINLMSHTSHFKILKKTSSWWMLQIIKEKQEVFFIKTLIYNEHVIQRNQKTETKIHMNINVKMNVIS